MKRNLLASAFAAMAVVGVAGGAATAAAPAATPDPMEEPVAQATRRYVPDNFRLADIVGIQFAVHEMADEAAAEEALLEFEKALFDDPEFEGFRATSVETFADATVAYTDSTVADGGTPSADDLDNTAIVVLVIRDGRFGHVWLAGALGTDPLPELLAVADKVFNERNEDEQPEDLLGRLPTPDEVPEGLVLESEGEATPTP